MNGPDRSNGSPAIQRSIAALEGGRTSAAAKGFENILSYDPENVEALYFLSVIDYQGGQTATALERIEAAIVLRADAADCHNLHGLILITLDRLTDAVDSFHRALDCDSRIPDFYNNLATAHESLGSLPEAETFYREAIYIEPGYAQAHSNLGRILLATGLPNDAEAACHAALSAQPDLLDARFNLAVAQQRQGKLAQAEATIVTALGAMPRNANLRRFLGVLRHSQGNLSGAEEALRNAISNAPELSEAHDNLAGVLLDRGGVEEAEACFKHALNLNPQDSRAHSNLLLCRNYYETDPDTLFEAHKAWVVQHAKDIHAPPARERALNARLRIGYVSADFRRHSVAYFFEPLLQHHDRSQFEVYCYANLENPDAVTERLQFLADHWRWVSGLTDDQVAEAIREDNIDILVDLSGHSAGNRLKVFQRRPAPVQASWLGYPNTTGLETMDYRITDAVSDPEGADCHATESLVRLENGFLCYGPPNDAPDVAPPPVLRTGYATFGSFNNLRKITPDTVETWSEILKRVPSSKLLIKARPFSDAPTADHYRSLFAERGIDKERLIFRTAVAASNDHLATYAEIDIGLDSSPYNGTTTTCEALWMGVPVVTLCGDRHAGRVGASLLTQTGLEKFISTDRNTYIETATAMAHDIQGLADLRQSLRGRLAKSSLCDAAGFCQRMEKAFIQMWSDRQR